MSFRIQLALIALFMIAAGRRASALDPFTAVAVVGAGANAVSAISDVSGEIAASADAFGELYGEIDSDAQMSADGERLVSEIREIEALAYEAGYTKEEVEALSADASNSEDAKKLSATLRSITRAVRAGKRVARLLMKLEQKAKLAEVESAQIEREQLVVLYRQLRADHDRGLREIKEKLKEERDRRNQIATLKTEEKRAGAKVFGRTGVLSFPRQASVIEEAIKMASSMRPALLSLILFVFLARAVSYQFGFYGVAKYGDLIRDAVVCSVLLFVFPELVRASVTLCNDLAARIGLKELQDVDPGKLDFPTEMGLFVKTRLLLEWLFQWIKYITFVTAQFLANFGLAFLILLFPIVIFSSQMLNFTIAWPIFLAGFLSVALWPLFWNATGMLAVMLWRKQDANLSDQIATILFSILQFLSPLIGIATLKGQPLSKSIGSAASTVAGAATAGKALVIRELAGLAKGAVGERGGGTIGRALSYPVNQAAGRVIAMGSRGLEAKKRIDGENRKNAYAEAPKPVWRTALREAAGGFVMNQAQAPVESSTGVLKTASRVASSLKRQPITSRQAKANKGSAESMGGPRVSKN